MLSAMIRKIDEKTILSCRLYFISLKLTEVKIRFDKFKKYISYLPNQWRSKWGYTVLGAGLGDELY